MQREVRTGVRSESESGRMGNVVVLEGLIAAGKTTLGKELERVLEGPVVFLEEPVATNPYLDAFYKDPKRWVAITHNWRRGGKPVCIMGVHPCVQMGLQDAALDPEAEVWQLPHCDGAL